MSKRLGTLLGFFLFALVVSASRFIEGQEHAAGFEDATEHEVFESGSFAVTLSR